MIFIFRSNTSILIYNSRPDQYHKQYIYRDPS